MHVHFAVLSVIQIRGMWNSIDSPFYTRITRNRINCWVVSVIFNLAKISLNISSTHNDTVRRPSIRPSVNFFLLSHLIRVQWSDFFETCPSCSPSGLVVSARIWFRFVDKYGRRWPTLFSRLSHLLRNHWRNFAKILHMNSSLCQI